MALLDIFRGKREKAAPAPAESPNRDNERRKLLETALGKAQREAQVLSILRRVDEVLTELERKTDATQSNRTQWQVNQDRILRQSISDRSDSNPVREALLKYASAQDQSGSKSLLGLVSDTTLTEVMAYLAKLRLEAEAQNATVKNLYDAIRTTNDSAPIESLVTPVSVRNLHMEKMNDLNKIREAVERLQTASV